MQRQKGGKGVLFGTIVRASKQQEKKGWGRRKGEEKRRWEGWVGRQWLLVLGDSMPSVIRLRLFYYSRSVRVRFHFFLSPPLSLHGPREGKSRGSGHSNV